MSNADDVKDELLEHLESVANFMRGMGFDPEFQMMLSKR